jgi:hypothetical protein
MGSGAPCRPGRQHCRVPYVTQGSPTAIPKPISTKLAKASQCVGSVAVHVWCSSTSSTSSAARAGCWAMLLLSGLGGCVSLCCLEGVYVPLPVHMHCLNQLLPVWCGWAQYVCVCLSPKNTQNEWCTTVCPGTSVPCATGGCNLALQQQLGVCVCASKGGMGNGLFRGVQGCFWLLPCIQHVQHCVVRG